MNGEARVDFRSDLINIIKSYFSSLGISHNEDGDAMQFATRYCEMHIRRIVSKPRRVHFSVEINESLRKLTEEIDLGQREKAQEAWNTVFKIWYLLVNGGDIAPHLSKSINNAHSQDGLLWDYGMHHFHLSLKLDASGFVERSDYLLFAILTDGDALLVDVRQHHDPEGLLWVNQDLLRIVHSNWPEITNSRRLHGVSGANITDREKKNLRDKNLNAVLELGEQAIAPLGWGTMADGSSTRCRVWASRLLHEIETQQSYFDSQPADLRSALEAEGIKLSGKMEFRLADLDNVDPSPDLLEALQGETHFGRNLCSLGFIIVEATTGYPLLIRSKDESS